MTVATDLATSLAGAPAPDWTSREIAQQPDVWTAALERVAAERTAIDAWLAPLLARPDLRIVLTGAGTSAYVGRALAPVLTRALGRPVEAVATTDIVASPAQWLLRDRPTLLVSYARSGNSPESIAAVALADALVDDCRHLVLSCNPDGALFRAAADPVRHYRLPMPAAALDQSFAMTSSFTSMVASTIAIFAPDAVQGAQAIAAARALLAEGDDEATALAGRRFRRVFFLGSGAMHGFAMEGALKVLELSAGRTDCYAESALGFRHGPKLVVDRDTLVVLLTSPDPHSRRYDLDLAAELDRDGIAGHIRRLDLLPALRGVALGEQWLGLVYILWCQQLAYRNALAHGTTPDDPCPTGEVNRVVQGVTIYPFDHPYGVGRA